MKIVKIGFLAILMFPVIAFSQEVAYIVKGKIGKFNAPAAVFMSYVKDETRFLDTAKLVNGEFQFKGTLDDPFKATLIFSADGSAPAGRVDYNDMNSMYVEKGTTTVTSADSMSKAVIKGGEMNTDFQKLQTSLRPSTQESRQLMNEYMALPKEQQQDPSVREGFMKRSSVIEEKEKQVYLDFIKANPNSIVCVDVIRNYAGSRNGLPETENLFNGLSAKVKDSKRGKQYMEEVAEIKAINAKTAIGIQAPDFTQNDPEGNPVKLSDLRGKYVLLDFWASWCGPCRAENPNVVQNYNTYKDKGFTVLGVSLDRPDGKEKWLQAIKSDGLTWTHVSDLKFWKNDVAVQYGIQSIPQNLLLDPQGKIIAKNLRGEELGAKLAEIFKDK